MSKGIRTSNSCECGNTLKVARTYQSEEGLIRYFKCKCGNKYRGIDNNIRKYYSPVKQICECSGHLLNTNTAINSKGTTSYYECRSCFRRFRICNGERTELFERRARVIKPHVYKLTPTHPLGRIIKGYAMSGSPRDTEKLHTDDLYIDMTHMNCVSGIEQKTHFDDSEIMHLITGTLTVTFPEIEEEGSQDWMMEAA